MTESSTEAEAPDTSRVDVERDARFHQDIADTGLVVDLGRDMEIVFLHVGPKIKTRVIKASPQGVEEEGYEMSTAVTEVSRVRMARGNALVMAMTIVENLVEGGKIKRESFLEQIQAMFDRHAEAPAELDSDD